MKKKYPYILLLLLFCFACSKDSFDSTPSIVFLSGTAYVDGFLLKYQIKDKEGDISDTIYLIKKILNQNQSNTSPTLSGFQLPDINKTVNLKVDVEISLDRSIDIGDNRSRENDTIVYGAYIRDADNHISDTAYASPLVLIKQ